MTAPDRVNLFGLDRDALRAAFAGMGEKPFRADQVMGWIYRRGERDFTAMSDLSKALRETLAERFVIEPPPVAADRRSVDGTRKWLLQVDGANAVETVFIPEDDRGTLCISSQAGCAMDCSFCATGAQGLSRNLSTAEIVAQVWFAQQALAPEGEGARLPARSGGRDAEGALKPRPVSNVVFMGMGEPLANYAQVLPALRILLDDHGFGLSKRRVTVSTSGLVPFMDRLRQDVDTALAVSLHAPTDDLRDQLVPINRKYPLKELMAACRRYVDGKAHKAHIVYEYVMLDGVNDGDAEARALAGLLRDLPAKVNLIPFNPFDGNPHRRSPDARIRAFAAILRDRGLFTTTRRTRGDDIAAACGQLAGDVVSRQSKRLRDVPVRIEA